jgi:hypothetical protein
MNGQTPQQRMFYEDGPISHIYRLHQRKSRLSTDAAEETISRIGNPSNILVYQNLMLISLFKDNKIIMGKIDERKVFEFAEGSYCAVNRFGRMACGIVDGPWGLATYNNSVYVSSFGSDQILQFSLADGTFMDAFGDADYIDCPEGLAIDPIEQLLYVANYQTNNIGIYDLNTHKFLRFLTSATSTQADLKGPESIALHQESNLLAVVSHDAHSLSFFDATDGSLRSTWDTRLFQEPCIGPVGVGLSLEDEFFISCYSVSGRICMPT